MRAYFICNTFLSAYMAAVFFYFLGTHKVQVLGYYFLV